MPGLGKLLLLGLALLGGKEKLDNIVWSLYCLVMGGGWAEEWGPSHCLAQTETPRHAEPAVVLGVVVLTRQTVGTWGWQWRDG